MRHWRAAGEQALAEHALSEAAGHFARAIELNARTPDGPPRRAAELGLRVLAGRAIAARQGWGAAAAVAHFARAERLSRDVEATPETFAALARLTAHRMISGRIDDAMALAQVQRDIAGAARDADLLLDAECAYGAALVHLGRHREALKHLAVAYELYDGDRHRRPAAHGGVDPAALALGYRAVAFACRSDAEGAHSTSPAPRSCCALTRIPQPGLAARRRRHRRATSRATARARCARRRRSCRSPPTRISTTGAPTRRR